MSSHEKAVLLAISDLQQLDGVANTKAILAHELTTSISRPSIFRALNKLEEHVKLKRVEGSHGSYLTVQTKNREVLEFEKSCRSLCNR
jgi:CTP-dependent riboflavin kinase